MTVAASATVIGFLYTDVSRIERFGFAVSALLLMAPGMILGPLSGLVGTGFAIDFGTRLLGAALFVALVLANRRGSTRKPADDSGATA